MDDDSTGELVTGKEVEGHETEKDETEPHQADLSPNIYGEIMDDVKTGEEETGSAQIMDIHEAAGIINSQPLPSFETGGEICEAKKEDESVNMEESADSEAAQLGSSGFISAAPIMQAASPNAMTEEKADGDESFSTLKSLVNEEYKAEVYTTRSSTTFVYRLPDDHTMCYRFTSPSHEVNATVPIKLKCVGCQAIVKRERCHTLGKVQLRTIYTTDGFTLKQDPTEGHELGCEPLPYADLLSYFKPSIMKKTWGTQYGEYEIERLKKINYVIVYRLLNDPMYCYKFNDTIYGSVRSVRCFKCPQVYNFSLKLVRPKDEAKPLYRREVNENGFVMDPTLSHAVGCGPVLYSEAIKYCDRLSEEDTKAFLRERSDANGSEHTADDECQRPKKRRRRSTAKKTRNKAKNALAAVEQLNFLARNSDSTPIYGNTYIEGMIRPPGSLMGNYYVRHNEVPTRHVQFPASHGQNNFKRARNMADEHTILSPSDRQAKGPSENATSGNGGTTKVGPWRPRSRRTVSDEDIPADYDADYEVRPEFGDYLRTTTLEEKIEIPILHYDTPANVRIDVNPIFRNRSRREERRRNHAGASSHYEDNAIYSTILCNHSEGSYRQAFDIPTGTPRDELRLYMQDRHISLDRERNSCSSGAYTYHFYTTELPIYFDGSTIRAEYNGYQLVVTADRFPEPIIY